MILTNLISLYIDYMNERKLSDNTVSTYKSVLNRFKTHYADKAIDDIKDLLNKSNNDIYAVSKFLGHSSVKTTEIYLHNDLNMLKKLVD